MVTMRCAAGLHAAAICLWTCSIMAFEPPGPEQRREAIGPTELLGATLRRALTSDADFLPIPKPGPHDWLAVHPEPGQTFAKFWKAQPNRPDAKRNRIYLVPWVSSSRSAARPSKRCASLRRDISKWR
jgi:hypothetical protein